MNRSLKCGNENRRKLFISTIRNLNLDETSEGNNTPNNNNNSNDNRVRFINGIDYIEVHKVYGDPISLNSRNRFERSVQGTANGLNDQNSSNDSNYSTLLLVFMFDEISLGLIKKENVVILGGQRIKNIGIDIVCTAQELDNFTQNELDLINQYDEYSKKRLLVIRPSLEGDLSIYTVKFIEEGDTSASLRGFDHVFSQIDFSFKIDCLREFDCKLEHTCPEPLFDEPVLDYMARDYSSYLGLVQSRIKQIMPEWKEKSPADITNVLAEILCYVGDQLSYFQDSASTETYLGTARHRISLSRHARLLDYFVYQGSNSRTWISVSMKTDPQDGQILKKGTKFLAYKSTKSLNEDNFVTTEEFNNLVSDNNTQVFETMHDLRLYTNHNEIYFYNWGNSNCCLPRGATQATLLAERKIDDSNTEPLFEIFVFEWNGFTENNKDQSRLIQMIGEFYPKLKSIFSVNMEYLKVDENEIHLIDTNLSEKIAYLRLVTEDTDHKVFLFNKDDKVVHEFIGHNNNGQIADEIKLYTLSLRPGDVLIYEEIRSPTTMDVENKNIKNRQAVKLRQVKRLIDPLTNRNILEIYWDEKDALEFPLCISVPRQSSFVTDDGSTFVEDQNNEIITIARGNIVLADNGYTVSNEKLEDVPILGKFYPQLAKKPITFAADFDPNLSALQLLNNFNKPSITKPAIKLWESSGLGIEENSNVDANGQINDVVSQFEIGYTWECQVDLLSSNKFAREFVVEIDNEGSAFLRFGDNKYGKIPSSAADPSFGNIIDHNNSDEFMHRGLNESTNQSKFYATYRVGNGESGNIGFDTINKIVKTLDNADLVERIKEIRNPLPAVGGYNPDSLDEIRQNAPIAFRTQERSVTPEDYENILLRHPEVQRAKAFYRWTGSWYTVYIAIDRIDGKSIDNAFKGDIVRFLDRFRLAGYDIEIISPIFVPLEIEIKICVKSGHYPDAVKKRLLETFSTRVIENGQLGFFHPNNFTFGTSLYLSQLYASIMGVSGVESLLVRKFKRLGHPSNNEIESGVLEIHQSEIIKMDNDPNFPDNGIISFTMESSLN